MKFTVNYKLVCEGTIEIEASNAENAKYLVANMDASKLAERANLIDVDTNEVVQEND